MTSRFSLASSLAVCVLLIGCSGGKKEDPNRPARSPVSGKVTLQGAPVERATVTLRPVNGNHSALALTDAAGRYVLGTFDKADGVVPGEYEVTITKLAPGTGGSQPAPDDPNYNPNVKPEPPQHQLPEKYADPKTSNLKASISTAPNNSLDFDLQP